jgi:hypothetical protein
MFHPPPVIFNVILTYIGDPSKDIGVEADMVLGDVHSTLYQNFLLKSASII